MLSSSTKPLLKNCSQCEKNRVDLYGDLKATITRHTSIDGKTQVENWRDIDPQLENPKLRIGERDIDHSSKKEKRKTPSLRIEEITLMIESKPVLNCKTPRPSSFGSRCCESEYAYSHTAKQFTHTHTPAKMMRRRSYLLSSSLPRFSRSKAN
jgi:hypothetical protein